MAAVGAAVISGSPKFYVFSEDPQQVSKRLRPNPAITLWGGNGHKGMPGIIESTVEMVLVSDMAPREVRHDVELLVLRTNKTRSTSRAKLVELVRRVSDDFVLEELQRVTGCMVAVRLEENKPVDLVREGEKGRLLLPWGGKILAFPIQQTPIPGLISDPDLFLVTTSENAQYLQDFPSEARAVAFLEGAGPETRVYQALHRLAVVKGTYIIGEPGWKLDRFLRWVEETSIIRTASGRATYEVVDDHVHEIAAWENEGGSSRLTFELPEKQAVGGPDPAPAIKEKVNEAEAHPEAGVQEPVARPPKRARKKNWAVKKASASRPQKKATEKSSPKRNSTASQGVWVGLPLPIYPNETFRYWQENHGPNRKKKRRR